MCDNRKTNNIAASKKITMSSLIQGFFSNFISLIFSYCFNFALNFLINNLRKFEWINAISGSYFDDIAQPTLNAVQYLSGRGIDIFPP